MVGIKPVADVFLNVKSAWENRKLGTLFGFLGKQIAARLTVPDVPVRARTLRVLAKTLARSVRAFSLAVQKMLMKHRENILFRQYVQERLADAACELYASSCVLSRLDALLTSGNGNLAEARRDEQVGRYYLQLSERRLRGCLASLRDNDDSQTTATADAVLGERGAV